MRKIYYLFILPVLLIACEENIGNIGLNLIPEEDLMTVYVDESTKVQSSYQKDDTIRSRSYTVMLGGHNDPVFGNQKAHLISRFYIKYESYMAIDIDSFLIDSVRLFFSLGLNEVDSSGTTVIRPIYMYGDDTKSQTFRVYELGNDIDTNMYSNYYSKGELPLGIINSASNKLLGETTTVIDTSQKYLYVKLEDNDFVNNIYNYIKSNYVKPPANLLLKGAEDKLYSFIDSVVNYKFIKSLKGLYVQTVESEVMASYTDPKIIVYYRETDTSTTNYEFNLVTSTSSFANNEERTDNYAYLSPMTFFENTLLLDNNVDQENQPTTYVSGGLGYRTVLDLSNLDAWIKNDSVIFNKVTIEIPYYNEHTEEYPAPAELDLICSNNTDWYINSDGERVHYSYTFSATINKTNQSYIFNVTTLLYYFQIIDKQNDRKTSINNYNFSIVDPSNFNDVDRVILDCGENSQNIKVKVFYTELLR